MVSLHSLEAVMADTAAQISQELFRVSGLGSRELLWFRGSDFKVWGSNFRVPLQEYDYMGF